MHDSDEHVESESIEDFLKRSVFAHLEDDYEPILGNGYLESVKYFKVDHVVREILENPTRLIPVQVAFKDHPPLNDEVYITARHRYGVVTNQRLFLLDDESLSRAPIPLIDIASYKTTGFWRKREIIILNDGERIERRGDAGLNAEAMHKLIERAKYRAQAENASKLFIDSIAALVLSAQRLVFARLLRRVEDLLRARAERELLEGALMMLEGLRVPIEQSIGLQPADAEIPDLRRAQLLNFKLEQEARSGYQLRAMGKDSVAATLFDATTQLSKSIGEFYAVALSEPPPYEDPRGRAKGLAVILDAVLLACQELGSAAWEGMNAALQVDLLEAARLGEAEGWTDETTFTEDPLGRALPDAIEPVTADETILAELLLGRLHAHRARILSVSHPDSDFIRVNFDDAELQRFAQIAGEKMRLTLQDGASHSMMIAGDAIAVVILTLSGTTADAKKWFNDAHGGYIAMLERYVGRPEVAETGAEVFCHMTFGHTGEDSWVNLSLIPLNSDRFRKFPIVAHDLLSDEEEKQHGETLLRHE